MRVVDPSFERKSDEEFNDHQILRTVYAKLEVDVVKAVNYNYCVVY